MSKYAKRKLTDAQQFEKDVRDREQNKTPGSPNPAPTHRAGDRVESPLNDAERARVAGQTGAAQPGEGPTEDDLAPETLIHEDGAASPREPGDGKPNDRTLRVARDKDDIGAGEGLDEAELAHVDPLDGEPWDAEER